MEQVFLNKFLICMRTFHIYLFTLRMNKITNAFPPKVAVWFYSTLDIIITVFFSIVNILSQYLSSVLPFHSFSASLNPFLLLTILLLRWIVFSPPPIQILLKLLVIKENNSILSSRTFFFFFLHKLPFPNVFFPFSMDKSKINNTDTIQFKRHNILKLNEYYKPKKCVDLLMLSPILIIC